MSYVALYRKYRPKTFEDFIDQDYVKKILVNSIVNNKISHAYLFAGPRGIGKTSMAKIFAKAINCENFNKKNDVCDDCNSCNECNNNSVDIIEIDAASNNGVDQIRDLKNKISVVPNKLKYKVYIVDEVHMLTNSAFNALLKTLEEPPEHVVFILATTEFYEVPETIVSRCQCFSFSRISINSLENRLKYIAQKEKIDIDDDVISEIAYFSNGGLRDAIGMLDKLNSFTNEKISVDVYKSINGIISQEDVVLFYDSILKNNVDVVLNIIDKVDNQGYDFKNFIERVMIYTKDKIIDYYTRKNDIVCGVDKNIELIETLNNILNILKNAVNPLIIVQVHILKFIENISREIIIDNNNNSEQENISREIISKNNDLNLSENKAEKNIAEIEKTRKNNQISEKIHVNLQNKQVRINNSMATANIDFKRELTKIWNNIDDYFMDEKYSKVSQQLSDCIPMVIGKDYAILVAKSEGLIENIYINLSIVEDFIEKIYHHLSIVLVTSSEFDKIKEKYIEDKKNNIVYQIQEECGKLIDENNLISQAIDVFGSDIVEIE